MDKRLLVVTLAGGLSLLGCKGKDKQADGTAAGSAAAGGSAGPAPAPPPAAAAASGSDLSMLAADSELVLGLDWQAMQASSLWKQLVLPAVMKEKEVVAVVSEIKARCGIDLQTDVKKVSLGIKGIAAEIPDGAAIVHGLDKAKALACPKKFEAEAAKERVVMKVDGETIIANDSDGYGVALTFAGDRALFMIGHKMSAERVKAALAGTGSLAASQAFTDMHGKLDTKATVWGLFRGATMQEELGELLGAKPAAVFGTVNLGDAVIANIRARLDSPQMATDLMTKLKPQVDGIASLVDKATIATDGPDVTLLVTSAGAKLDALIKDMQ